MILNPGQAAASEILQAVCREHIGRYNNTNTVP
jgi:hypothetical protein